MAGLVLVVAGIRADRDAGRLGAFAQPGGQAGLRWGAATGGLIASYTVVDAYAVKALGVAPVVLDWFSNLMRFFLLLPLVLANPGRARVAMRGYWGLALGVGLLSPLSYILVLAALRSGAPLSLVAPMREMSMMVGALMGMFILREPVGPVRLAGCAVLVLGVVLLSAG
ncbi:MAG: EamA family transporter [Paracoccaceae bacterium]